MDLWPMRPSSLLQAMPTTRHVSAGMQWLRYARSTSPSGLDRRDDRWPSTTSPGNSSRAAGAEGIDLAWKPRFDWLSGLGHIEYFAQAAPPRILNRLAAIPVALGGDADLLRGKRRSRPACDFLWLERTIIELDEFQHFSTARRPSLDFYDRYRAAKKARDFPIEGS